jgi:hypothetical protein
MPLSDCIDANWLARIQRKSAVVQLMLSKLTGYSGMVVITSAGGDSLASNSVRRTPVALACDVLHWPVFGSKFGLAHRGVSDTWIMSSGMP